MKFYEKLKERLGIKTSPEYPEFKDAKVDHKHYTKATSKYEWILSPHELIPQMIFWISFFIPVIFAFWVIIHVDCMICKILRVLVTIIYLVGLALVNHLVYDWYESKHYFEWKPAKGVWLIEFDAYGRHIKDKYLGEYSIEDIKRVKLGFGKEIWCN